MSSQRAFFGMAKRHKKPVAGPPGVRAKSHMLRGEGLRRRRRRPGEGRDGRPVEENGPDLVVATRPADPKTGRPWRFRPTGGQNGRPVARTGGKGAGERAPKGDQLVGEGRTGRRGEFLFTF